MNELIYIENRIQVGPSNKRKDTKVKEAFLI